ncbi:hypothetical protein FSZ31_02755 [Sphingorhabdus soli]|uniref:Uncharacterized protein n=1 Tax=Flavisphingopyxis soli TaxID=2601267 RepID=A0A5C6UNK2_9SPHN|nr:hypothetical protein [Sphingorhabdus soli]TXC73676.1 hypothetical protein FSZ31_02755 [Sphingorhabdus soli]
MRTLTAFTAALSLAAMTFAVPATASGGAYYQASLASPAAKAKLVAKGLLWNCDDTACAASQKSPSRDAIVCSALAKQVGPLTGFAVAGKAFDAAALESCNAGK